MQTLVIVSHPDLAESQTQQFFLQGIGNESSLKVHHLDALYSDGVIDVEEERALLKKYDRVVFQFPFYWYSMPALLKQWLDTVLDEEEIFNWAIKELGVVVMIGVAEKEYGAGGRELFTIDEYLRPFQGIANKLNVSYLPVFPVYQFSYQTEQAKIALLIGYRQYLMLTKNPHLAERAEWFKNELTNLKASLTDKTRQVQIDFIIEKITENQDTIEQLQIMLEELK